MISMKALLLEGYGAACCCLPPALLFFARRPKGARPRGGAFCRDGLFLLFLCYLAAVFSLTGAGTLYDLLHRGLPLSLGRLNLTPFASPLFSSGYLLNVLLFVPLGLFLVLLRPGRGRVIPAALCGFFFSLAIECSQLFNSRATDIDDLAANTLGALAGALAAAGLRRLLRGRTAPAESAFSPALLLTAAFLGRFLLFDELRRELYQRGFIARYNFDKLVCESPETRSQIALGRRISKYSAPILITGESGTGKSIMAQCIHNESLMRNNAFVPLDCSAWMPETLDNMLFGNYSSRRDTGDCMAELAQDGTLYLNHIEALPLETQYKLLSLIQGRFLHNGSNRPTAANVRVIASSDVNLISRVEKGEFRSDLYYALSVLSMELLPLRRRRADIMGWVDHLLDDWQEKYKRYVHLTQGARAFLSEYDWPGNLNQVNNVCERIVLLTEKRNIDEGFVRRQLEQVTPKLLPGSERLVLYKDQKAVQITELLRKYNGNREKVAAELGVSKTTLWRYIKKYAIEEDDVL